VKIYDSRNNSLGLGLRGIQFGANHVTFVESSASVLEVLNKNLKFNSIAEGMYEIVKGNVFNFLNDKLFENEL